MFLLLTLNIFHTFSTVFIVDFEQVNVSWVLTMITQGMLHILVRNTVKEAKAVNSALSLTGFYMRVMLA